MLPDNLEILKLGGVGVIPTDTIYGVVAQAFRPKAVDRIYDIKGREGNKPFIILIASLTDLRKFKIHLSSEDENFLQKCWPGAISVILPVSNPELEYLHRGTNSLAFRLPDNRDLLEIIKEVGPLVAPSANPEGKKPAVNIFEAKKYFGHNVDFYEEGGVLESAPSTLIRLAPNEVEVLRVGKAVPPIHDLEKIVNTKSTTKNNKKTLFVDGKKHFNIIKSVNKEVSFIENNSPMSKKEKIFYITLFFTSLLILLICILIRLQ